jgi:hypothetical protein
LEYTYRILLEERRLFLPRPHGGANSGVYLRRCSFHIFPSARARIIVRERRVLNCGNYVFLDFFCPRNALSSGRRSLVGWRGSKETRSWLPAMTIHPGPCVALLGPFCRCRSRDEKVRRSGLPPSQRPFCPGGGTQIPKSRGGSAGQGLDMDTLKMHNEIKRRANANRPDKSKGGTEAEDAKQVSSALRGPDREQRERKG